MKVIVKDKLQPVVIGMCHLGANFEVGETYYLRECDPVFPSAEYGRVPKNTKYKEYSYRIMGVRFVSGWDSYNEERCVVANDYEHAEHLPGFTPVGRMAEPEKAKPVLKDKRAIEF